LVFEIFVKTAKSLIVMTLTSIYMLVHLLHFKMYKLQLMYYEWKWFYKCL